MPDLFDHASYLPTTPLTPGVYLMINHEGEIVYVGKAKSLRVRLRSYFAKTPDPRPFVLNLPRVLREIQTISTHTEKEALLLERTLILRHKPRYNVALKFGSAHLYLRLDPHTPWPKLTVTRSPKRDRARYFGPYLSGADLRAVLHVVERAFQLRTCDDRDFRNRARPCLQYQIKRCSGPCVLPVERADYMSEVEGARRFLLGQQPELIAELKDKMSVASAALEFERAARYRDQIQAIERSLQPQEVAYARGDHDAVGVFREGDAAQIVIIEVRGGVLLRSRPFSLDQQGGDDVALIESFLHLYYAEGTPTPPSVLIPCELAHHDALTERLTELRGGSVELRCPQRGRLERLLTLARENAEHAFFQARQAARGREESLVALKRLLRLTQIPRRIECFDISIFQGEAPVASRVVFEEGVARKRKYRAYQITSVEGTDDFAMMREAITRRFTLDPTRPHEIDDLPQLLMVDGGKGQLAVAVAVLSDLGFDGIDVIGLAKSRYQGEGDKGGSRRSMERVFLPNTKAPISLKPGTSSYRLLTQLRDEAHRVAITEHRRRRDKARLSSPLDQIQGIGPARRKLLLKTFGSLQGVYGASARELAAVPGVSAELARRVYDAFRDDQRD